MSTGLPAVFSRLLLSPVTGFQFASPRPVSRAMAVIRHGISAITADRLTAKAIAGILVLCTFQLGSGQSSAAALDDVGDIFFPVSASPVAVEHFTLGVAYLHLFSFKEAGAEFRRARQLAPDFAMAYWGEAMSLNHPLLPESDALGPAAVLRQLGATPGAVSARAATALEQGFLRAAAIWAFAEGDGQRRREQLLQAMEELLSQFPRQQEVRAFHILALLSVGISKPFPEQRLLYDRAADLSKSLLQENPRHPGAAHYLIHSLDQPTMAGTATTAAGFLMQLSPRAAHARHMPSHVFLDLGRWNDVAALNETAFYMARALWEPGDSLDEIHHLLEWGLYGDLQLADLDAAGTWLRRAEEILELEQSNPAGIQTLERMNARFAVESLAWTMPEINQSAGTDTLLASGLAALALRDIATAAQANQLLKQRAAREIDSLSVQVSALSLDAAILHTAGEEEASHRIFRQAVALQQSTRFTAGLPQPVKPLRELYGEILLRDGRFAEAATEFEAVLAHYPFRSLSVLGLARSLAGQGLNHDAVPHYQRILDTWGERNFPAASEAKTHLSLHAPEPAVESPPLILP